MGLPVAPRPGPPDGYTDSNHPRYELDSAQIAAIERFLAEDVASLSRTVPVEYAERRIRSGGCLFCHGRDGVAAVWSPPSEQKLRSAAEDADQNDFALSTDGETGPDLLPPDLTWTGAKLRSVWLADFLAGRAADRPRPHLRVRMPAFPSGADILAAGLNITSTVCPPRRSTSSPKTLSWRPSDAT